MERKPAILILLSWLSILSASAQVYNAGFIKPMNLPFNLAGSFGEPRPDHFHSGIDIKTNEQEGYVVVAVGDGYVSRIRVSPYGYGKSVYITHPNGYTSVYGHLSGFNAGLEDYVYRQHYLKQQSELDLYPAAGQFKVKQGDTIAFSGNTGGSGGPHLHFEIRDSKTEHALNPLDFYPKGFYVDTIPPQINRVKVYQLHEDMQGIYEAYTEILDLVETEDHLTTDKPIGVAANASIYISLEGFDKQDDSENKNGIGEIDLLDQQDTLFRYRMSEIDFDKTRMCNAFVDYEEMIRDNGYFYNGYRLKLNRLPIYSGSGDGRITVDATPSDTATIIVHAYDYNANKTSVQLRFYREDEYMKPFFNEENYTTIPTDRSDSISFGQLQLRFPAGTFYDNTTVVAEEAEPARYEIFVYGAMAPLQKSARIKFTSDINKQRDKVVIVRLNQQSKETALKTTFDKTHFYAETKALGTFYLKYDTINPVIQLEGIDETGIRARISDALSGISSYNAYIDWRWVNVYYDAKNDRITYRYDEFCLPGEHKLKIVVTDAVGNSAIFTQTFKR